MNKDEMRKRIELEFADVPYPGDDNIGVIGGRDDSESISRVFRGRSWKSLKPRELWEGALDFMTPEAFHYYLPAFLLVWDDEEAGDASSAAFHHLTPPGLDDRGVEKGFFHLNFQHFTVGQKRVISEFLDFTHEEIRRDCNNIGGLDEKNDSFFLELRRYWSNL